MKPVALGWQGIQVTAAGELPTGDKPKCVAVTDRIGISWDV